jgi:hypothetical protein
LKAVLVPEGLLERMELPILGHALDRRELLTLGLDGEHGAALDRLAVDEDRAGAALARIAPDVGARQPYDVPKVVHEQKPRFDFVLVPVAVDSGRYLVLHTLLSYLPQGAAAPGTVPVNQAS